MSIFFPANLLINLLLLLLTDPRKCQHQSTDLGCYASWLSSQMLIVSNFLSLQFRRADKTRDRAGQPAGSLISVDSH
uniref:Putative secreted protein n=1 Tax=Anopheles marajoara TaxID=58244 RepID=A0A2M4CCC3_9DIPT